MKKISPVLVNGAKINNFKDYILMITFYLYPDEF